MMDIPKRARRILLTQCKVWDLGNCGVYPSHSTPCKGEIFFEGNDRFVRVGEWLEHKLIERGKKCDEYTQL